ncbi:transcriptional regulator [Synechococcus sp. PCC 7502]|uniref:TetR/AcrR family transcriptional regulator n=1 Tax=Synechococcus sp. PCC 7502 TaxID=1173263 RepID=UPI00029FFFA0|nr:TetR/AcrR family transcriptional regulator [Synechococcus sp. PCC 7502]AFY72957.1 transcriptional regulator [Synechococcus sp. PCC 7502]
MKLFNPPVQVELDAKTKILQSAQKLFARRGFDGTTTKDLAIASGVAEGTIFRHFANKKAILIEVATQGWINLLTDLLTELSEMGSYKAIAQMMQRRMLNMAENLDMMKVCFMEVQFHPELRDQIQLEVVDKMTDIAEVYFEEAIAKGIYRKSLSPKVIAKVFVGMFAVAGFSNETLTASDSAMELKAMAEGVSDIFLNGVLAKP